MLPATRGAEVLYHNVLNPVLTNVKVRTQGTSGSTSNNPFNKTEGFNMAGTTAPSSFERELPPGPFRLHAAPPLPLTAD